MQNAEGFLQDVISGAQAQLREFSKVNASDAEGIVFDAPPVIERVDQKTGQPYKVRAALPAELKKLLQEAPRAAGRPGFMVGARSGTVEDQHAMRKIVMDGLRSAGAGSFIHASGGEWVSQPTFSTIS